MLYLNIVTPSFLHDHTYTCWGRKKPVLHSWFFSADGHLLHHGAGTATEEGSGVNSMGNKLVRETRLTFLSQVCCLGPANLEEQEVLPLEAWLGHPARLWQRKSSFLSLRIDLRLIWHSILLYFLMCSKHHQWKWHYYFRCFIQAPAFLVHQLDV